MSDGQPILAEVDGTRAIVVEGVIQSVAVDRLTPAVSYWHAMLPDRRPASVLLLGLGGGTLVHLLTRRFGALRIVGVDASAAMVELARTEFGLAELTHVEIVIADAFAFVASCADRFDQIYVDLFDGPRLARGVVARPFLRQLCGLLSPGGTVTFNLPLDRRNHERLHRLRTVFGVVRPTVIEKNVVVSCRP